MSYSTEDDVSQQDENTYLDTQDNLDQVETQEEQQEMFEAAGGADAPFAKKSDSLFSLFQKVWKSEDSSKVANLNNVELGRIDINVRDCQYLELLGTMFHHPRFGKFFKDRGEITLKTSASKKGWFTELFVSQKKFTTRATASSNQANQTKVKKWSLFPKTTQTQED